MERARAYGIFTRVGAVSEKERVRFLTLHQRVRKSRTKCFPCYNLFILYIPRFSHPKKYILALAKFELFEQVEYTENIILSKLPDKPTRDDCEKTRENTIRLNRGLCLNETIFSRGEKLVSPL